MFIYVFIRVSTIIFNRNNTLKKKTKIVDSICQLLFLYWHFLPRLLPEKYPPRYAPDYIVECRRYEGVRTNNRKFSNRLEISAREKTWPAI